MHSKANPGKTDERQFELDLVWMRFRDPKVETAFLDVTLRQSVNFIRAYLIAGAGLYALFALLDIVTQDPALYSIFAIRFLVVIPVFLGAFALTFFPIFFRISQAALAV